MRDNNELIKSGTLKKFSSLIGLGAGAAGASTIGTAIGGMGILGTIGSSLGLTIAAATPIGWILGGAALGGAIFYGASDLISKKGYSEGDISAQKVFSSDVEKQMYFEINKKISEKLNFVAKNLLSKLPVNEQFIDFRNNAIDGLDKGTMNPCEIIQICCECLNEDYEQYIVDSQMTIGNIESFIKISTLLSLADKDYNLEEKKLIRDRITTFFNLKDILTEVEIDLIFKMAIGNAEDIKAILDLDCYKKINLLHTFILMESNDKLLVVLLDFLQELANVDGKRSREEEIIILSFETMLFSKLKLLNGNYSKLLIGLKQADELYSRIENNKNDKFIKKIKNIIKSEKAYGYCLSEQHVLAIDDHTIFGSADDGFVFTPLGIFTNKSVLHFIPYHTLKNNIEELEKIGLVKTKYFPKLIEELEDCVV
jgi:hypothetical protein